MKILDVASHQHNPDTGAWTPAMREFWPQAEAVIIKATEGTYYVNDYCDPDFQQAKKDNKLRGFYHYAAGGDPRVEAEFFYHHTKNYVRDAIPALDWEAHGNASWGDLNWCRRFVGRYHELSGIWPMIYIQASEIAQAANCANDCALWVAYYPTDEYGWTNERYGYDHTRYPIGPWNAITIWQFGSNPIDCNVGYLDADAWHRIQGAAGGTPNPAPTPAKPAPTKPAPTPKPRGRTYVVQPGDTLSAIAARFGVGINAISGYRSGDPNVIYPNEVLTIGGTPTPASSKRTYVVQPGDTLSAIAARFGVGINAISGYRSGDPNVIYPNEILTIN
ncbi:MAG: GH25 family lysozyme [Bifidobacterium animalis]|nr:LysM peptidoglycan-binding domain-containing protein [Bifidobacterium animalis]MDY5039745.1 GH25 family lysozyme [Bifidobacterium animalis]